MKFPFKRLFFMGAIAIVIGMVMTTGLTNFSEKSSTASLHSPNNPMWLSRFLPFPAGVAFAQGQPPAVATNQMSEQYFKNIQVLKGIPVDEFMGEMGLFSAALSVCCGDCHVGAGGSDPHWEADQPRKVMARKMVTMVNNINKDNFGGLKVVTCWTCHRGAQTPSVTPAIDNVYSEGIIYPKDVLPPVQAGGNVRSVDQVFDKYIQALGGAQRLAALTSWTAKGSSTLYGEVDAFPTEIYAKAPNQYSVVVHETEGNLSRTSDGRNGWFLLPLTAVGEYQLNASRLDASKFEAQLAFPAGIRASLNNWHSTYPIAINGKDVDVVQGTSPGGLVATLFFDKQTGLLTRTIQYANSSMGRFPTQIDYSDYRPVAGVMMPYKFTYGWISGREEYVLTEIQPNVAVNAAQFNKPVQRTK